MDTLFRISEVSTELRDDQELWSVRVQASVLTDGEHIPGGKGVGRKSRMGNGYRHRSYGTPNGLQVTQRLRLQFSKLWAVLVSNIENVIRTLDPE